MRTGQLTISDQYRTQTAALSGTGIGPLGVSLAPFSPFNFPGTGVGLTSAAQNVTLSNNEGSPLSVQSIAVSGNFAMIPGSSTCGITLAAYAACTMQMVFVPTSSGSNLGSLTVTDSAANSPQILQLTGAGVDFALAPDGNTSLTISSGQNAVFPLLLSSAANVTGTAAIVCTGMPANSTCNVNPASVALGGTATVSVTVLTGVASTSSSQKSPLNTYRVLFLTSLMPLSLLPLRRHRLRRLTCGVVLCMLLAASGCGAGRTIPVQGGTSSTSPLPSGPATPAGTYTIVASATSAGLTRTVNLTLIVR